MRFNLKGFLVPTLTVVAAAMVSLGLYYGSGVSPKNFDLIRDTSVQLNTPVGMCSGTLIEDPYIEDGIQTTILTAGHCGKVGDVATLNEWTIIGNRKILGKEVEVTAVARSTETDVMIFQTDTEIVLPSVPIYGGNVNFGDRIFISGYGQARPQDLTFGYAGFVEESCRFVAQMGWSSCDFLRMSNQISPGNSGSGVWKETWNGYVLVGVVSNGYMSRMETSSRFSYSVTVENLRSFIQKVSRDGLDPLPAPKKEIEEETAIV